MTDPRPSRAASPARSTRRGVLAGVAAGLSATAGCLSARHVLRNGPPTDDSTEHPDDPVGGASYVEITAYPARLASEWARSYDALGEAARSVVAAAVETGDAEWTGIDDPPLRPDSYVAYDGRYRRVTRTEAGGREVQGFQFELETLTVDGEPGEWTSPATVTAARRDAVEFDALAPVDQRIVREGVGDEFRGETGFGSSYPVAVDDEAARERSTLADGETHYVRYEGELLAIVAEEPTTLVARTVRYELPAVADDAAAFAAHVRREHVLDLDAAGLSSAERDVLEQAIDGTVERESPFSDGVGSLLERLRGHESNPLNGDVYVDYESEPYRVEVLLAVP